MSFDANLIRATQFLAQQQRRQFDADYVQALLAARFASAAAVPPTSVVPPLAGVAQQQAVQYQGSGGNDTLHGAAMASSSAPAGVGAGVGAGASSSVAPPAATLATAPAASAPQFDSDPAVVRSLCEKGDWAECLAWLKQDALLASEGGKNRSSLTADSSPLHYALRACATDPSVWGVVRAILAHRPDQALLFDLDPSSAEEEAPDAPSPEGVPPIFLALNPSLHRLALSEEIAVLRDGAISDLVRALPQSLRLTDCAGRTPFHLSLLTESLVATSWYLFSFFTEASAMPDDRGYFPLHTFCARPDAPLRFLGALTDACPGAAAVRVKSPTGDVMTPASFLMMHETNHARALPLLLSRIQDYVRTDAYAAIQAHAQMKSNAARVEPRTRSSRAGSFSGGEMSSTGAAAAVEDIGRQQHGQQQQQQQQQQPPPQQQPQQLLQLQQQREVTNLSPILPAHQQAGAITLSPIQTARQPQNGASTVQPTTHPPSSPTAAPPTLQHQLNSFSPEKLAEESKIVCLETQIQARALAQARAEAYAQQRAEAEQAKAMTEAKHRADAEKAKAEEEAKLKAEEERRERLQAETAKLRTKYDELKKAARDELESFEKMGIDVSDAIKASKARDEKEGDDGDGSTASQRRIRRLQKQAAKLSKEKKTLSSEASRKEREFKLNLKDATNWKASGLKRKEAEGKKAIEDARKANEAELATLRREAEKEVRQINKRIKQKKDASRGHEEELAKKEKEMKLAEAEAAKCSEKLQQVAKKKQAAIQNMREEHKRILDRDRQAFEKEMDELYRRIEEKKNNASAEVRRGDLNVQQSRGQSEDVCDPPVELTIVSLRNDIARLEGIIDHLLRRKRKRDLLTPATVSEDDRLSASPDKDEDEDEIVDVADSELHGDVVVDDCGAIFGIYERGP